MAWQLKNKRLQTTGSGSLLNSSTSGGSLNSSGSPSSPAATNQGFHLPLHLDAGEDTVRQFATSQIDTQKTAFMRWVNVQLATTTTYGPMSTIERDLRDGKRLIGLLEIVSKEPLKPERGNMRIHQMANVSKALSFLEKRTNEPLGSIGNEDIVDGNVKLTLGLIWIIIYRFQIQTIANTMAEQYPSLIEDMHNMEGEDSGSIAPMSTLKGKKKGASQQQVDAKQALLRWVRYQLEDYSDMIPPIQDFHRSWRTGVAFAALIHRHDPDYLPDFYTAILQAPHETIDQWRATLATAFDTAFEKMALPRLLDPEDLVDVETPDERSILTYVSEYYLIMSKHQQEQESALAEGLQALRTRAKEERLALAGEDQQEALRRIQEEEERKKKEEEEELERIRLRRMEIEGWSIRAAERAREEEEARRKRKEEEEQKSLQRKLRREQREREHAMLLQKANAGKRHRISISGIGLNLADSGIAELETTSEAQPEPMDPEELERRQAELDSKLEVYLEQAAQLLEWLQRQESEFPETPDITAPLDRTKDMDPFKIDVEQKEEERLAKEDEMTRLHSVRDELLDYESPELTPEQSAEVDKMWWDIDATWTTLSKKSAEAKNALQEMKWVVQCSQEVDHVLGDIQRFEEQLQAATVKRSQDTPQDRSQLTLLDHQDTNLFSMRALLKKHATVLSSLLESSSHTAPDYLLQRNMFVSSERLPRLVASLDVAQNNLANDRLLRTFISAFDSSQDWIQKSAEWLTSLTTPAFVSEDIWMAGESLKEYLARDQSQDDNLEQYQSETNELKIKLDEEHARVAEFKSTDLEKLDQDAQSVIAGLRETDDTALVQTTKTVQDMTQETKNDLARVEDMLPKELKRCAYAMRVLDYLFSVCSTLSQLESAFNAVNSWVLTQPSADVEEAIRKVEASCSQLEATFKDAGAQPAVWDSIQIRHTALTTLIRDLRSTYDDKQDILKADQQMKQFLEYTQSCQMTLREFRSQLYGDAPFKGFISEDTEPFDKYSALVADVGRSLDEFETGIFTKYQDTISVTMEIVNTPGSRQDPTVVQTKVASVNRLLSDIKALRVDRERDIVTIAECRRVATLLQTLNMDLSTLESKFAAFEITDRDQKNTLNELIDRAGQLANEFVLLEQGPVYRHITRDPSCTTLLKDIRDHQNSIQQAQSCLQSGLEIGEQWTILWDQFMDRVETLQQYLDKTEKGILDRGIAIIDGLADGDANWKKSEDELHDAEDANHETQSSLKEFQKQRMLELSNLKVALHQSVQQSGGIESLDQYRSGQYHEAEQHQQRLREHLQRLYLLNSKESFQLEILGQRLVWSQQLVESKKELDSLALQCQGIVEDYARLLEKCGECNETTDLTLKAVEQFKQQMDNIAAGAAAQREASYDVTLTIYASLTELATVPTPGEKGSADDEEKKVPLHLEVELYEFKNRYTLMDLHLEYGQQIVQHLTQSVEHVRKMDSMDSGFLRMSMELKAEKEASPKTLEKLEAIRKELECLAEESRLITKIPKPADKIMDVYAATLQPNKAYLDKVISTRLEHSHRMNRALDSLLFEFKALLAYQDGLRKLSEELNEHSKWVRASNQKVQSTHDQIKQMFKSWPGDELEQMKSQAQETMVVFDVEEQVVVDELDVLMAEMERELALVQAQKLDYLDSKQKIELALHAATASSKQLQMELEWSIDNLARQIQQLETDIRTKSLQLQALGARSNWENEIVLARIWFKDFAEAVIMFAREQAKWRANHREFDDGASMRSVRTTASRLVIDRLGGSVLQFEEKVEYFETESRPKVDKAWSDLCSALGLIARSIPEEFQRRQTALEREFEEIRKQVVYSAQIVAQRKSLEEVALSLEGLEGGYGDGLDSSATSIKSGWTATGGKPKSTRTKEKGWSRFQAKVKKLTKK
ncbi:Spectrin beta chain, non-erythrocytic 5 [Mortierella claussenii]|nr:Spectrin beta chain, non-erythrocytic 5 [Mortierella claussenii]